MKKILTFVAVAMMALCTSSVLVSCGGDDNDGNGSYGGGVDTGTSTSDSGSGSDSGSSSSTSISVNLSLQGSGESGSTTSYRAAVKDYLQKKIGTSGTVAISESSSFITPLSGQSAALKTALKTVTEDDVKALAEGVDGLWKAVFRLVVDGDTIVSLRYTTKAGEKQEALSTLKEVPVGTYTGTDSNGTKFTFVLTKDSYNSATDKFVATVSYVTSKGTTNEIPGFVEILGLQLEFSSTEADSNGVSKYGATLKFKDSETLGTCSVDWDGAFSDVTFTKQ